MFLHFRKALCKAEKKGVRWWVGVSYVCTATSSCCCPLQQSTAKKKTNKSVNSNLAHLLTGVAMLPHNGTRADWKWQWHKGACALRWIQKLGMEFISYWVRVGKWVSSLVVTLLCFKSHLAYRANTSFQPHVWVALLKTLLHAI
jgi:hypothetical protein